MAVIAAGVGCDGAGALVEMIQDHRVAVGHVRLGRFCACGCPTDRQKCGSQCSADCAYQRLHTTTFRCCVAALRMSGHGMWQSKTDAWASLCGGSKNTA